MTWLGLALSTTWLYARMERHKREVRRNHGTEAALRQANRTLRLFSRCHTAIVHATDEQQLLAEICRIAVEDAGYCMAWVGRAEHDEVRSVQPVTFAGNGAGFLERVRVSWGDDPLGHGTVGKAIRSRRPVVARDLLRNPAFKPWREALHAYGYRAALAMPIELGEEVYGVLLVYATEPDAFDSTEVSVLDEVAGDLSHALRALRARRELATAMQALSEVRNELERRVVERTRELRVSREKYRELVQNANSIIMRMDTKGSVTFANEFAVRFFGYSARELVGHPVMQTIVPETESTGRDLSRMIRELTHNPDAFAGNENENIRKNGERVWIAWTNRPINDASGILVGVLCIGNDITSLKKTEAELVKAKDAAESADRLKSAFLATMSHELRTPLNSIIGFTGILLQKLTGPLNEEQQKQLSMVQESARHLLALITDVLDISKMEAGQLTIISEPFDVGATLNDVASELMPLAQEKGLTLSTEIPEALGLIVGDRRRFAQVVVNLVGNAIKFTERGSVTLRCAVRRDKLVLAVHDTGIGLAAEQIPMLFRPFYTIDNGNKITRKHDGTGLGLSISKRLVELMGGSISVESTPGVGSTFTVQVPLRGEA
jgi:PAS domain S-box-containing protein